jgi:hypothetical protein
MKFFVFFSVALLSIFLTSNSYSAEKAEQSEKNIDGDKRPNKSKASINQRINVQGVETSNQDYEVLYSKEIIFNRFFDPGFIETRDGDLYYFGYKGITYKNISTWSAGRVLRIEFSAEKGSIILDPETGQFAFTSSSKILDEMLDSCVNQNSSNSGIVSCVSDHIRILMNEKDRIFSVLKKSKDSEIYELLTEMDKAWSLYKSRRYQVGVHAHRNETGSMSVVDGAFRALAPVVDYVKFIDLIYMKVNFQDNLTGNPPISRGV